MPASVLIVASTLRAPEALAEAGRVGRCHAPSRRGASQPAPIASRRRSGGLSRGLALTVLAAILAGCAIRPGPETLDPVASRAATAQDITVLAVTDRSATGTSPPAFGDGRGVLAYERFTLQRVGPAAAGKASRSALAMEADPSKDFITVGRDKLSAETFESSVNRSRKSEGDTVVLFVHGYNYSYQEAVFRLAQLRAEAGEGIVPVLFSWPSQADFRGYVADRDSTIYARDDLVKLLTMLGRSHGKGRVAVFGHSMGAWLVMEALRQLRLQRREDVIARIQVGLAAPDIDIDVFRAQLAVVGRLYPPLTVLVSHDDRALAVSGRLAGGRPRLGAAQVDDPAIRELAARNGVQIIDVTKSPASDSFNHDRFVGLAARYAEAKRSGPADGVRQAGVFLLDTTGRILSAPFSGTARAIAGEQ